MGFKYEPRIAIMEFEEPYRGLEVRVRLDLPATRQLAILRQLDVLRKAETGTDVAAPDRVQVFRDQMELLISVTDGWNWEDADGSPVPMTVESLMDVIPGNLATSMLNKWAELVNGLSGPLGETSSSGETLPDNPIPTQGGQ